MTLFQISYVLLGIVLAATARTVPYPRCNPKSVTKVLTFNTGLTPRISDYESRRELVPEAIKSTDADVVCLQEVWFGQDVSKITEDLKTNYKYSYSSSSDSTDISPPCSYDDATVAFLTCGASCDGAEDLDVCLLSKCLTKAFAVPQKCLTCSFLALRDLDTMTALCFQPGNRINLSGLLVLSKENIKSPSTVRYLDLPGVTQLLPRSYIEFKVPQIKKAVCTHLTSDSPFPYLELRIAAATAGTLNITSWKQQQLHEINTLRSNLARSKKLVIAGDMNNGPALNGITGELSDNYDTLVSGFQNDFIDSGAASCTFCADNNLINATSDILIDHILVKGITSFSSKRVLESDGATGQFISDHYGVETSVCAQKKKWGKKPSCIRVKSTNYGG